MNSRKTWIILCIIAGCALLIRLLPALNALGYPERFIRPDTPTYLEPAQALLDGRFSGTGRAPGYSYLAALVKLVSGDLHLFVLALTGALLGTLTIFPVYGGAKELFGKKTGLAAAILFALNLTAIANAPMLLSDTFFGLSAALQFYFFTRFFKIIFYLCSVHKYKIRN